MPIRRASVLLITAFVMVACSSSDDDVAGTTTAPSTSAPVVLLTPEQCAEQARVAAEPLQEFVAEYEDLTAEEWNALDPPPDIEAVQAEVVEIAQAAVDRGCDPTAMQDELAEAIEELEGHGEVGRAIVAALRGLGPPLGPPQLVPATTQPRDENPSTVTLEPGDDLDARLRSILDTVAPGSTVEFASGVFELTEPVVVDIDVSFVGAGRDATTVRSTAEGVAIAFVGPGGFKLSDMTVAHSGTSEASVLLAIEGPVRIARATVTGGVAGADEAAGGGHGIVFAFDPIEGFPERTPAQRVGALVVEDTIVTGNAAAGILATGTARPRITASTVTASGGCGLCYVGDAGGSVTETTVEGNEIGVQAGDTTSPSLRNSTFARNNTVGISFDGESAPTLTGSVVEENGEIGVQIAGTSTATVSINTIRTQGVGVLATDTSTPSIESNILTGHDVGVQIGGEAHVDVTGNGIMQSTTAAVSMTDASTGEIRDNVISDAPDVGVQVAGTAAPDITGNTVSGAGSVGISFLETSSGTVSGNRVSEREIGIQLGGSATATVTDNDIENATAVGILFGEGSGGSAAGNRLTIPAAVGVLVGGTASPSIDRNTITDGAVGLVFREDAAGTATFNTLTGHAIAVQVVDRSAPFLDGNVITDNLEAGVVYGGSARGELSRNTIVRNGNIGVQVGESAGPDINGNEIRGPGIYGMIYRDSGAGNASRNLIADLVFAIQLSDSAAPDLIDNTLSGIALTAISYADNTGGSISGTDCGGSTLGAGISISAPADPVVGENNCSLSRTS